MKRPGISAAALALVACMASPALAEAPPTQWDVTEAALPAAGRDEARLRYYCPDLFGPYAGDVEAVTIRAPSSYVPAAAPATYIAVKISDDPQTIPRIYRAWGHVLHYYVRVGGVSVKKDQSRQVCGWPAVAPAGHDAYYWFEDDPGGLLPEHETEIERHVIDECLLASFWEEGLDNRFAEDEFLELMKTGLQLHVVEAAFLVRGSIVGESREARMAAYEAAARNCIDNAPLATDAAPIGVAGRPRHGQVRSWELLLPVRDVASSRPRPALQGTRRRGQPGAR